MTLRYRRSGSSKKPSDGPRSVRLVPTDSEIVVNLIRVDDGADLDECVAVTDAMFRKDANALLGMFASEREAADGPGVG
jgi:hypothetical protein